MKTPKRRPLLRTLILLLICSQLVLAPITSAQAQNAIPNMGDDGAMSLSQERQLGDQIAREIYQDPQYLSDPVLDDYLYRIWHPLWLQAKRSGALQSEMEAQFAWRWFLIRDKSVNAFALPGGYFGVNLGLIALSNSPDSLASVLAHEITHVTQRHISRGISKQAAASPLLIAGILVGLLAMRSNPQVANAALSTAPSLAVQNRLNYTRDFEREADRLGFALMQPSGYNPEGFVEMFRMLGSASRLFDNGDFPYLRTHPLNSERIADMRSRLTEDQTNNPVDLSRPAVQLHRLMAARAKVLADLSVDALKAHIQQGTWLQSQQAEQKQREAQMRLPNNADGTTDITAAPPEATLDQAMYPTRLSNRSASAGTDPSAVFYAAALAAWHAKDSARARSFYEQLKASLGPSTSSSTSDVQQAVRWLGAELEQPITPALDIASPSRTEMLLAAQQTLQRTAESSSANKAARPAQSALANAASRLQGWVISNPNDIAAWELLARLQLALGQRVRANIASAEGLRAQLDFSGALAQYQTVQNLIRKGLPADPIDSAIIDSKVRELQQRVRDNEANKKP